MSTVFLYREPNRKFGDIALMEQQAVYAITRALLARPTGEGMRMSQHKVFVPNHIDILPIMALAAEDFATMVEPESEESRPRIPFMLYADERGSMDKDEVMSSFLHPRWFEHTRETPRAREILRDFRPEMCVITAAPVQLLDLVKETKHRFRAIIAFTSLLEERDPGVRLSQAGEKVVMADELLEKAVFSTIREMRIPSNHTSATGVWEGLYGENESRPELEPFVAFGAALEMALLDLRDRI